MNKSLVKDSFIYSSGSFLIKAVGFFLIPVYTRFLTVGEYGILSLLMVILQLASFVFLFGVSSASMRFYFDADADDVYRFQVYGNAVILLLIFPVVLFVLLVPVFYYFILQYLPSVPFFPFVFVILIIGLLKPIQKLVLSLLRVQKRAHDFVKYTFSFFVFQTITVIIAVAFLGYGLKGVIYAFLLANLCFWGIALKILKKNADTTFSKNISKSLLVFGIPLIPYFVFTWMLNASGRFMLERYASLEELGIFSLAAQFSGMLFFLSNALDKSILPYFYETAQKREAEIYLGRFTTKYFIFFGLLSLLTFIFAEPLVLFMVDQKFHSAILYIPLLILAGWLNINYKIFYWSLMHSKQTGLISFFEGITVVFMVGLLLLFLKQYKMGIQGVVYVMVIIGFFKNIVGYFLSQRFFKIRYNTLKIGLVFNFMLLSTIAINFVSFGNAILFNLFIKVCVFLFIAVFTFKMAKIDTFKEFVSIKSWYD